MAPQEQQEGIMALAHFPGSLGRAGRWVRTGRFEDGVVGGVWDGGV